jgi:hypothetical protein
LKQISHRFDELDAQTGEVMAALRNADSQRTFILNPGVGRLPVCAESAEQ